METLEYDWCSPMWPDDPAVPVTVTAGDLHHCACQTNLVAFWLSTPVLSVLDADPTGTGETRRRQLLTILTELTRGLGERALRPAATGGRAAPRPAPPRRTER